MFTSYLINILERLIHDYEADQLISYRSDINEETDVRRSADGFTTLLVCSTTKTSCYRVERLRLTNDLWSVTDTSFQRLMVRSFFLWLKKSVTKYKRIQ